MNVVRRYWAMGLILSIVIAHAAAILYVRSRLAELNRQTSCAVAIGRFRFQTVDDLSTVYQFQLHAMVDPSKRHQGESQLSRRQLEIREQCEQMLRQVDAAWLDDPTQTQIRDRLMEVVLEHLEQPLVRRVVITDWLELPVRSLALDLNPPPATLAGP